MDSTNEILTHAGECRIEEISIASPNTGQISDISGFMLEINLYENIFSSCMSGNLIVADAINLISNLPLMGNEYIRIKLRTPTLEDSPSNVIQKTFQIYSISDRILNDDRSQYYNISFMSIEGNEDQTTVVTKSYKGTTDEVAQKIYKEHIEFDRPLVVLDTPHVSTIKYTSNHWSPFKNLNYISKISKGATLEGSDYLFFETNKSFYFASIESLIYQQRVNGPFDEYVLERNGAKMPRRISSQKFTGNVLPDGITVIENLKMLTTIDTLSGNNIGAFSSSVDGYDFYTKKIIHADFDFVQDMKRFTKTGPVSTLPASLKRNPLAIKNYNSYNTGLYNDYGLTDEEDLPDGCTSNKLQTRRLQRASYLKSFENNKLEMLVPGRTDIEVGRLISVLYPSSEPPNEDLSTVLDPILSGLYLISAIHHKITIDRHTMNMEIIKNGISNAPEKVEMEEEVDNVS
jgi:hypothetical protein